MKYVTPVLAALGLVGFVLLFIYSPTRLVALGTILVAILAVWGERVRSFLNSPEMRMSLRKLTGDSVLSSSRQPVRYYHILVRNVRPGTLARNVRVLCTRIWKRREDADFGSPCWSIPLQLRWTFAEVEEVHELRPNIRTELLCDLGFVRPQRERFFMLATYIRPADRPTHLHEGETMRVALTVEGDNFTYRDPYVLEISYDGEWSDDPEEMSKHLVIDEVQSPHSQV